MNFTPIARMLFSARTTKARSWEGRESEVQDRVLRSLLKKAENTLFGKRNRFRELLAEKNVSNAYSESFNPAGYEEFRPLVMRMIEGESDLLWPGQCNSYAQSSGTSGGRSKYVPITPEGLRVNHYGGASYTMSLYLSANPASRIFSGKGLILGGSFATELHPKRSGVSVGDLSATLIDKISPAVNLFRVPDKSTALLSDWNIKLPRLAEKAAEANITSLSGVPSWMMRVLMRVLELRKAETLAEVWPNLEVFFHGGISFEPYRSQYERLTTGLPIHFFETYNASEGYFATADSLNAHDMLLLLDIGVYYEFRSIITKETVGVGDVEAGKIYELVISTCNGLWRYRTGDTVRIESTSPLKITIAGRTHSFINAFGEELMEDNAEHAIAETCGITGRNIMNYHAAPVYADGTRRGRHQWIIEWGSESGEPLEMSKEDTRKFAEVLDTELRKVNSDYDAKRNGTIFLDPPEVVSVRRGAFDEWLAASGSHKLGGQRKVPRLSNDRTIADVLLTYRV